MKRVSAAIIKDRQILLVKEKGIWILPGCKVKNGEDKSNCLKSKISEVLSGTKIEVKGHYDNFIGKNANSNFITYVYLADLYGSLRKPSNGVSDAKFIDDFHGYKISPLSKRIIHSLKKNFYLDIQDGE